MQDLNKLEVQKFKSVQSIRKGGSSAKTQQLSGNILDKAYMAPHALDIFAIETKSRKAIGELIRPLNQEMERDRVTVAGFIIKSDEFIERLDKIEYILGLDSKKPQVFVDIENKIAETTVKMEVHKFELLEEIKATNERINSLKERFSDSTQQIETMNKLQTITNSQISETQESL